MRRLMVVAAALVLAACAQPAPPPAPAPPAPPTAAALVDHEGDSPETAVHVPADAPNEGIDFENNWIYDHFGRFRRLTWALGNADGRHYKMIKFEVPDHSEHTVYFDVTESWAAWSSSAPAPVPPPK